MYLAYLYCCIAYCVCCVVAFPKYPFPATTRRLFRATLARRRTDGAVATGVIMLPALQASHRENVVVAGQQAAAPLNLAPALRCHGDTTVSFQVASPTATASQIRDCHRWSIIGSQWAIQPTFSRMRTRPRLRASSVMLSPISNQCLSIICHSRFTMILSNHCSR